MTLENFISILSITIPSIIALVVVYLTHRLYIKQYSFNSVSQKREEIYISLIDKLDMGRIDSECFLDRNYIYDLMKYSGSIRLYASDKLRIIIKDIIDEILANYKAYKDCLSAIKDEYTKICYDNSGEKQEYIIYPDYEEAIDNASAKYRFQIPMEKYNNMITTMQNDLNIKKKRMDSKISLFNLTH